MISRYQTMQTRQGPLQMAVKVFVDGARTFGRVLQMADCDRRRKSAGNVANLCSRSGGLAVLAAVRPFWRRAASTQRIEARLPHPWHATSSPHLSSRYFDLRGVNVQQATSSAFKGIKVGQVPKPRRCSSEPHSLRAAWAKRWPWRVFTRVIVAHGRSGP